VLKQKIVGGLWVLVDSMEGNSTMMMTVNENTELVKQCLGLEVAVGCWLFCRRTLLAVQNHEKE